MDLPGIGCMDSYPEQLHELLMYCIDFSRTMLEEAGAFYPFGVILSPDGRVGAMGGHTGEERPDPHEVYKLLNDALLKGARGGQYSGTALAANATIPARYSPAFPDGVRVHLEREGYARLVYVPYRLGAREGVRKKRVVEMSAPFSVEIKAHVFGAQ